MTAAIKARWVLVLRERRVKWAHFRKPPIGLSDVASRRSGICKPGVIPEQADYGDRSTEWGCYPLIAVSRHMRRAFGR